MIEVIALVFAWLTGQSTTIVSKIPSTLQTGVQGMITSVLTRRYVLIAVLIGLSMFGSNREEAQASLQRYVIDNLGASIPMGQPVEGRDVINDD